MAARPLLGCVKLFDLYYTIKLNPTTILVFDTKE